MPESVELGEPSDFTRRFGRRHGIAVLHHLSGKPFAVDNVRLPDGSRGRARVAHAGLRYWRRPLNDHEHAWQYGSAAIPIRWRWGSLVVTPDDVIFEDDRPSSTIDFAPRTERLDRDLYQDREIKELLMTIEGCNALFSLLVTKNWQRDPDDEPCWYTWDDAGSIIAMIRGLGETFNDVQSPWLNFSEYATEYKLMRAHLNRLGWEEEKEESAPSRIVVPVDRRQEYVAMFSEPLWKQLLTFGAGLGAFYLLVRFGRI